jgi:hypothetical protein
MRMKFDEFDLFLKRKRFVHSTRMGWFTEMTDEDFDDFIKVHDIKNLLIESEPYFNDKLKIGILIVLSGKFNTNVDFVGNLTNKKLEEYMKFFGYAYRWQFNWGQELYFIKWL